MPSTVHKRLTGHAFVSYLNFEYTLHRVHITFFWRTLMHHPMYIRSHINYRLMHSGWNTGLNFQRF